MANSVFMHKIVKNTIVCVSEPLETLDKEINGHKVKSRSQANRTFGLLCLVDGKNNPIKPQSLGLTKGDEMPGFRITEIPVLDRETKEETGLFWVE